MNTYTVYQLVSPDGKSYIGATRQALKRRWRAGHGYKNNPSLWADIQKHGWHDFLRIIHGFDLSAEEAHAMEIDLIREYRTTEPEYGYNRSTGGPFGRSGCPAGENTRDLISKELTGKRKGIPHTLEHRTNISLGLKGHPVSEETREKLKYALGNRFNTYEARKHQRENTPRGGKHHKATPVLCVETGTVYRTISEASEAIGLNRNAIARVLSGKQSTAGGFHWRFEKEKE